MADIELVIKIPEEMYDWFDHGFIDEKDAENLWQIVKSGTPLPKGHGKLIDEKEINIVVNGVFTSRDKHSPKTFLNVIHDQCIEAVGADKAESEG